MRLAAEVSDGDPDSLHLPSLTCSGANETANLRKWVTEAGAYLLYD
jgi:hypothetical protein